MTTSTLDTHPTVEASAERSHVVAWLGLTATVVLAGIDGRRLHSSFDSLEQGYALLALWVGCLAIAIIALTGGARRGLERLSAPSFVWFWAWSLWSLITSLGSEAPIASLALASGFGLLSLLSAILSARPLAIPVAVLTASVAFVGLSLVANFVLDAPLRSSSRLALLALEANQLARYMGVAAICGIWVAARTQGLARAGAWLVTTLVLLVLGATESRTSLLAFGIAITYLIYRRYGPRSLLLTAAFVAFTIGGLASLNKVDGVLFVFSRGNVADITSATGRTEVWPPFARQALDSPITGYGLGSIDAIGIQAADLGQLDFVPEHAHNLLLQVATTTGLVGVALLGAGIVGAWRHGAQAWPRGLIVFLAISGVTEGLLLTPSFAWAGLLAAAGSAVDVNDSR